MEPKGLFAGAQNITVHEANINNVAGAYNDHRTAKVKNTYGSGSARDQACYQHQYLNVHPTATPSPRHQPPSTPPPAAPLPSLPVQSITSHPGLSVTTNQLSPPTKRTPGPPRSPVSGWLGVGANTAIRTLNYIERTSHNKDDRYKQSLDHLVENLAAGAVHDSAERYDAPKCHPETRIAVQRDILHWIENGGGNANPEKVLWISGPAGAGKTAIAGSIADKCQKDGSLAATFFFSASSASTDRQSKRPLIPTLVYQLIQHKAIRDLKEQVLSSIHEDPVVFKKHLDQQLEALILNPLRKVAGRSDYSTWPKVIIIDGLDECDADNSETKSGKSRRLQEENHREILSVVAQAVNDPSFPFRIIVVSRPEPVIRSFFSALTGTTLNLFLDDKYRPDSDIAFFLEAKFDLIRRRYNLPDNWVSKAVIKLLVEQASGQFIYAATILRFIESTAHHPQEQLKRVLEWRRLDDSEPFAVLDTLYRGILQTSPNPMLAVKWLSVIYLLREFHHTGDNLIKPFLESAPGETEYLLGNMTSLLNLSDSEGEPRFQFYHKSLLDFLGDSKRSADLHVSAECRTRFLQDRWYQILKHRGPQVVLRNPRYSTEDFLNQCFHRWYSKLLDTNRLYNTSDVEWWLQAKEQTSQDCREMFVHVHAKCPSWYRCLPACKVWRRQILQHCIARSWKVPGRADLLRDRFHKHDITTLSLSAP